MRWRGSIDQDGNRDLAYSDGNYFVSNKRDNYSQIEGVGDFGVAGNGKWNYRFNLTVGYYY